MPWGHSRTRQVCPPPNGTTSPSVQRHFKDVDLLWSNVVDGSALLIAEDHVEHNFIRRRTNGRRRGLRRGVLLGLLLGGRAQCAQQKYREKNRQPVHGRDLQRKRLRCKCSASSNTSKNDFFSALLQVSGSFRQFAVWLRPNLVSILPRDDRSPRFSNAVFSVANRAAGVGL